MSMCAVILGLDSMRMGKGRVPKRMRDMCDEAETDDPSDRQQATK